MTPTRSTTWSAARQRQALDLSARYRHGASINQLARDTGLSKGTVINRLRLVGTPMRTPQQTRLLQADPKQTAARSELAATMRRWYESGTSVPALAAVFECSQRTVRRRLAQAGATLRTPGQTRALGTDGQTRRKLMRSLRAATRRGPLCRCWRPTTATRPARSTGCCTKPGQRCGPEAGRTPASEGTGPREPP